MVVMLVKVTHLEHENERQATNVKKKSCCVHKPHVSRLQPPTPSQTTIVRPRCLDAG